MKTFPCREYQIYRRFFGDDGVNGEQMTEKPLDSGLWCALQSLYRHSLNPDNYLKDSYLKMMSYPANDTKPLLCGAILLEPEQEPSRVYFLQYTSADTKKALDIATLDSGLWCAINTMCRYHTNRKLVDDGAVGHFSLVFYHKKQLLTKAMLYSEA
jgi:hypothetical protein